MDPHYASIARRQAADNRRDEHLAEYAAATTPVEREGAAYAILVDAGEITESTTPERANVLVAGYLASHPARQAPAASYYVSLEGSQFRPDATHTVELPDGNFGTYYVRQAGAGAPIATAGGQRDSARVAGPFGSRTEADAALARLAAQ